MGRRDLGRLLQRSGMEADESRRAVGALKTCGLLVPQARSTQNPMNTRLDVVSERCMGHAEVL
jgi:hypothetical protein